MSGPMLDVSDLHVSLPGTDAVRGVSFALDAGETVALVGASGAGKSLTAKAVLGLLPRSARTSGRASVAGTDVLGAARGVLRRLRGGTLGYVPQDALTALSPVHRVGDQIAAAIASVRGLGRAAALRAAADALEAVGIPDPAVRARDFPHQFSGGMRQRAVIALATANAPELIVADEPTTALDARTGRQVLDLLSERCAANGAGLLVITHDLGVVEEYADRVLAMADGRLVADAAPTRRALPPRSPVPDTTALLEVDGLTVEYRMSHGGRHRLAERMRRRARVLVREGRGRSRGPSAASASDSSGSSGTLRAVDGVSFQIAAGETLALIGPSGSGKSSTAAAVLRLVEPGGGTVRFEGRDLTGLAERELRALRPRIQPVLQDPYGSLSPRLTAGEAVAEPLRVQRRWDPVAGPARVRELFALTGLDPALAERRPHELSGGQCQRVNIARALASEPRLLVLDEPTSALDAPLRQEVFELLIGLQERLGLGYLFICHDLEAVRGFAHRVAVMEAGRIVRIGSVEEFGAAAVRSTGPRRSRGVAVPRA
ncbi:ABC transporter ATP-binding protein [Glycomyces sp. TRM65418]|uniref:ATP-binding cassette domain-containing protein n=1 Tax=Glycomyces sp. TRM65418 TaxID=2867006 RepID=UPI001CE59BA9|nr:ABC transporter ATP-binding protein [Glycomyces sp. TRM65418]MCC3763108.1 ABC transporter ATP-binding protein [Glycomyces sp. TRM65418]QZD57116.1 ABC transporter ATP-binding protein [Glycomyces sp. TRM65418]